MDKQRFLQNIVDCPLRYAIKSPDMDLYDFGFGDDISAVGVKGKNRMDATYILHVVCRFKVIWKNEGCKVKIYHEDTPADRFHSEIERLIGKKVMRVAISDKNDLWLDFGDCQIVFATFENNEESWRFFTFNKDAPHLVASNSELSFR